MKKNTEIFIYLKWLNRILSTLGLITFGILLIIYLFNFIGKLEDSEAINRSLAVLIPVFTILITGIISGLTYQGVKNHADLKKDKLKLKEFG